LTISIVIPTLNEAANLPRLLSTLSREETPHEVLVVDGGSGDGTPEIAERGGAVVLAAPRGRGRQIACGAAASRGDMLLFLHADSRFPAGGLAALSDALAKNPDAIGGNFRLLFDGDDRFSRWLEGFYGAIRRRGFYYGDSGIFIRRTALDALGGIRPIALMEDYDLTRRMELGGRTLCIAEPPLMTSSRRFRGRHPVAIFAGWVRIHLLYYLGVRPDWLAWLYGGHSR
jgi:rSAM/selenodomain-associated transferase 2